MSAEISDFLWISGAAGADGRRSGLVVSEAPGLGNQWMVRLSP